MAPRATWKGQLRISLVSFPVCVYNAISSSARISMNQLHRDCHRRVKQQMTCPEHGPVDRGDIVKGYEFEKDKYVIFEDGEIEQLRIQTNHTIDIDQFVDAADVGSIYFDAPYYVAPDGVVADEPFRVIREAMRKTNKAGIGRVVMSGREHVIALQLEGKGMRLTTLRTAEEVRGAAPYMESIREGDVAPDQVKLAEQLIAMKQGAWDPAQFRDRYQEALLNVIKAKIAGAQPVYAQEQEAGGVINLMEALKQSLSMATAAETPKKPAASTTKQPAARKERKTKRA